MYKDSEKIKFETVTKLSFQPLHAKDLIRASRKLEDENI